MIKRITIILILFVLSIDSISARPIRPKNLFKIKTVTYDGNQNYTDKQLNKVIISHPSVLISPVYFNEEIFRNDLRDLQLFYHQNGYLEATVTGSEVRFDSTQKSVALSITLREGELTRIEGVSVLGNTVLPDEKLQAALSAKEGAAFKRKDIENSTLKLLRSYADIGYLDADITPDIRLNSGSHTVLIDFIIQEKSQFSIGKISISGPEKTKSRILLRELNFREGEIVNYSKLLQSQRKLYLTGLFQSVFVRSIPSADNNPRTKDILIEAKEKQFGEFNVSVGYGSVEKARAKTELLYSNLRGTAQKISLVTKISKINRGIELSFTEPWTFHTPWRTDLVTNYEYLMEPGYNLTRLSAKIQFGRKYMNRSNTILSYRHENNNLSDIKITEIPSAMKSHVRGLKLSLIFDNRDNLFNTKTGTFAEFSNELAGSFIHGTNAFFISNLRLKQFISFTPSTVMGSFLDLGWIDAAQGFSAIPLNERFYAGGPNVLRAFDYQRVGPLVLSGDKRIPLGGRYQLVWNAIEVRQNIYKSFGLEGFLDLGNVWQKAKAIALSDIRHSVGLGIRYNSPIGMARLDYAINFAPRPGEENGRIYFSMGQAF